ncbi:hypothetical protein, conserved [Entamoeba dispar SAW760]|uniref:Leucine rich repeat containing protein BspA family protein n=1 Tax=Entamoeba dispar (strain ATCC PRA-260 / SAW760) TaxID=370354 RepID=B0ES66_ENTDS|nr:uncharacterized protein EDI_028760 [Entamoeba dispar SAW760]EDR22642.1 hypothetical protein, conserved [Entamoeba dispar SAW760]|eukprot:EDR22642.1 hypothetical protein, conserved [Entamoeba dispar SAW760]
MKLGHNEIMITSMYFNDINDFINLEIGIKRFQGNMERFHFNPIPLNQYSRRLFTDIETFHIYNEEDEIFDDGKIFKYVIWYLVDYSTYLQGKEEGNICKNIIYTEEDRKSYGNTIPSEVKSLGYFCFRYCYELTSIDIPTSINEIRNECFYECTSLKSINIPSSISKLGYDCFYGCTSLISINIDNLQYISEERIFMNEPVLVSIKIPENLQIINGKNIEKKDINKFIIPSSITKLGYKCFYKCSSLTSINISSSVSKLGDHCFQECSSLTSINIPSSVSKLGEDCFYECYLLKSINIPTSISKIGNWCFKYCSSLKSINIPSSIISFGRGCFYKCGCEDELMKNKRIPRECFDRGW